MYWHIGAQPSDPAVLEFSTVPPSLTSTIVETEVHVDGLTRSECETRKGRTILPRCMLKRVFDPTPAMPSDIRSISESVRKVSFGSFITLSNA